MSITLTRGCVVILCCNLIFSFPPQQIREEYKTKSHRIITLVGIFRTAHSFIKKFNLVNDTGQNPTAMLSEYFGNEEGSPSLYNGEDITQNRFHLKFFWDTLRAYGDSYQLFLKTIDEIVSYQNDIQRSLSSTAFYHVNGEQINLAHNYIRSLRKTIISLGKSTPPDVGLIRKKIGHALYTLQSFYSNTNWVEMFGETVYGDFGRDNVQLHPVADISEDTCFNCPTDSERIEDGECRKNVISSSHLTSGYKSDQDIQKPVLTSTDKGKCSHGTQDDNSRFNPATGGIYKGRSSASHAPHYHLHNSAAEAATQATHQFLINESFGILNEMPSHVFQDVFMMRSKKEVRKSSITFVIDVTGSMGDNIASVKKATTKIVDDLQNSTSVPDNYILVTFSDPQSLERWEITKSGKDMINLLENLSVDGGGDCPEYALSGIIRGATLSNSDSMLYFCSDADAKDADRKPEVIQILQNKNIKPVFLLTSNCTGSFGRRKRGTGRVKRQSTTSVFDSIAEATGGSVYKVPSTELETVVEEVLKENFPSSTSILKWLDLATSDANNIDIEVDETVSTLQITIEGTLKPDEFHLFYPNGSLVTFVSRKEKNTHSSNVSTIQIKDPENGIWNLSRQVVNYWSVNVTADSVFDFSVLLMDKTDDGFLFQLKGNPISGKNYTLVLDLQNLPQNATASHVTIVKANGDMLNDIDVTLTSTDPTVTYEAVVNISEEITGIQFHGLDSKRNAYVRSISFPLTPVQAILQVLPFTRELRLNTLENIQYISINVGNVNITATSKFTDDKGYTVGSDSSRFTLGPGETVTSYFQMQGTIPLSVVTYTVSLYDDQSGSELQTVTNKLLVSSVVRPSCNVTSFSKTCSNDTFTTENCSSVEWNGNVELQYSGIQINPLQLSNTAVKMTHGSLNGTSGPVVANISGDCCTPSVVLSAIDADGFITQCHFEMSVTWVTKPIKDSTEPVPQTEGVNFVLIGGIIGGVAGIFTIAVMLFMIKKFTTKEHSQSHQEEQMIHYPNEDESKPVRIINTQFDKNLSSPDEWRRHFY